ncbi:BspA family leucine-rich repeat surface protein [Halobacteriovorax sp.]|uniref:BspA family leucine-rich repeat surface protein n=1 Tax=Halobacteriovorax sp. TaxID=2020862 RepID=UPI003AF1F0CF
MAASSNVTRMVAMFRDSSNLITIDLSSFDTSNVIHMDVMFADTTSLQEVHLDNSYLNPAVTMNSMFQNTSSLETLVIPNWDLENYGLMSAINIDTGMKSAPPPTIICKGARVPMELSATYK